MGNLQSVRNALTQIGYHSEISSDPDSFLESDALILPGVGAFGVQSGALDSDSNVLIYVILSEARLNVLLADFDELMNRSYRVKVIVTDVMILPRKKPSMTSAG